MKTISAEEASKISCSNNAEVIERDKVMQNTMEDCMAKIERSAKAGNFIAKCCCQVRYLNDVCVILESLKYHTAVPDCNFEPWHTTFSSSMIVFEVSWDCLD